MHEESLDLRDYIDVILRRWWLLLAGPVLGVTLVMGLGFAVNGMPSDGTEIPVHKATALVLMEGAGGLGNSPDLVMIRPVLEGAVDKKGLSLSVPELRDKVSARSISNTNLIEISVEDSDGERATSIANAVSESLIEYVGALRQAQSQSVISSQEDSEQLQDLALLLTEAGLIDAINQPVLVAPAEAVQQSTVTGTNNALRNVLLAAFVGGLISVGAVVVLEHLWQPVRSPEQLESRLRPIRFS